MPEVIADLFQAKALLQQVRGARVPQRVWPIMAKSYTQGTQPLGDDNP